MMNKIKDTIKKSGRDLIVSVAKSSTKASFQPIWHNEAKMPDSLKKQLR